MQRPIVSKSQISCGIELVPPCQLTERPVVFDAERDRPADVQANARLWLELELVLGACEIALECGIKEQLETRNPVFENRGQLEGARALAEGRARGLIFDTEPHVHREPPLLRRAKRSEEHTSELQSRRDRVCR